MVALCNDRQVVIRLSAEEFSKSPSLKAKYLFFLRVAEDFELENHTVEDFYDWIAEPLFPTFRRLESLSKSGESLVAVPQHEESQTPLFGIPIDDSICSLWPCFTPSEIQPSPESNVPGRASPMPSRVVLPDGTKAFSKLMRPGDEGFLLNELDAYGKIRDAPLSSTLRISRLLALVRDEDSRLFGLLLSYIDCQRKTLSCAAKSGTDPLVRRKWAEQIASAVAELHQNSIIWGDVKPDNTLIDQNNDAWLIDFGGSYTEGWVPKELAGTSEGDLVGLEKVKQFLEGMASA
ncbi:hypothetical protein CC79DRAFT_1372743 [Sarocladium strictum]